MQKYCIKKSFRCYRFENGLRWENRDEEEEVIETSRIMNGLPDAVADVILL